MAKLFPSLNNCSMLFRLFNRSFFPRVNCFATIRKIKKLRQNIRASKLYESSLLPYLDMELLLFQFTFIRNRKLFPAFCTTTGQNFPAISSLHTFTKSMYRFTTTVMRLECTFHNYLSFPVLNLMLPFPLIGFYPSAIEKLKGRQR